MFVGLERKPGKKSHVETILTKVEIFAAKKQAVVFVAEYFGAFRKEIV